MFDNTPADRQLSLAGMPSEYEYEGVTYHELLPRVLLLNFKPGVAAFLKNRLHNAKSCTMTVGASQIYAESPVGPHEVDILFVRDMPERVGDDLRYFTGLIAWPSGHSQNADTFFGQVLKHGGICVFFISRPPGGFLAGVQMNARPDRELLAGKTAHRVVPSTEFKGLCEFVERHIKDGGSYVGLNKSAPTVVGLLEDTSGIAGIAYAAVDREPSGGKGLGICLPDYGENSDVLDELLSDYLPDCAPHLFPFRRDLSWLRDAEFRHPAIKALEERKADIQSEAQARLQAIDSEIEDLESSESHLRDLLTTAGDSLKAAVQQTLTALFSAAGVTDATILDVDADPELRGGRPNMREDIRIAWRGRAFLLDVSGRERHFRQGSLNQLSEHHRLYRKEHQAVDIHSLLIGNFNYGDGTDPRRRGFMFGSTTADLEERLLSEGHGAIGTYDLYRIARAGQRGQIQLSAERIQDLLNTEGILDYAKFVASCGSASASSYFPVQK